MKLPHRHIKISSEGWPGFYVRSIPGSESSGNGPAIQILCQNKTEGDPWETYPWTKGLRPVFILNSNVKVTGGSGNSSSPYTLGI